MTDKLTIRCTQLPHGADLPLPACAACLSPWTDLAATGASMFPYRTFTMLCGLATLMLVSRLVRVGPSATPLRPAA